MEIWTLFLRRSVADSGCDDFLFFFAAFLQHVSGSSSELSFRVCAQALAHEKIGLSDLHRRGAFVVIHIPSR